MSFALTNGSLQLPPLFTNLPAGLCPDPSSGTAVGLGKNSAITVDIVGPHSEDLTVRATASLNFANIAVLPQLKGFATELCRASLVFNPGGLPYLTNLMGVVVFPFPEGETNRVELLNGAWGLDGLPTGRVELVSNLRLFDEHGLKLTLLGRGEGKAPCDQGMALTAVRTSGATLPTLILTGATEVILPTDLVTEVSGDRVRNVTCTTLTIPGGDPLHPSLDIKTTRFEGTFHLGGANGLLITNSVLTINNLDNLFAPTVAEPFEVSVGGTFAIPQGPAFTLKDAKLSLTARGQPPNFSIAGVGYSENEFSLAQKLPVRVSSATFQFKDPSKPLADLFKPANIDLRFSGIASIPSSEKKLFEGTVTDLEVTFTADGKPILKDVDGFSLLISGLKLPPITDIGGGMLVSGLSKVIGTTAGHPAPAGLFDGADTSDLFFAGSAEGSYQGYKLKLILAFRTTGMIGACLDANFGAVGIPLDAGYLGGVLLTGASGGIALGSGFTDPCEFTAYIGPDGKPKPGVTELFKTGLPWDELQKKITEAEAVAAKFKSIVGPNSTGGGPRPAGIATGRTTNEFGLPCPGDCPPPTVNIFCQPHPDQERFPKIIIARFSSISEETLNSYGITREWMASQFRNGNNWATAVAARVAGNIRTQVLSLTPLPTVEALGSKASEIMDVINQASATVEASLIPIVIDAVANQSNGNAAYDALVAAAYRGAPCPDITLAVSGTLSHATVSSFLSGTVGAVISSAGVAGISGHVNVLGVPVGNVKGFVAATDERANLNPTYCAEGTIEVGPLSLGTMRGSFAVHGAALGLAKTWVQLLGCISETLFFETVQRVAPRVSLSGKNKLQVADQLTVNEQLGVIATLYSRPGLPADLRACVSTGLATLMTDVNPELLFCGDIQPRLFGFPMSTELVAAGMQVTKTNFSAITAGSPTLMIATAMRVSAAAVSGGIGAAATAPLSVALFIQDRASVGFSFSFPNPEEPFLGGIEGRFNSPAAVAGYLDSTLDTFVENATFSLGYSLSPLGFKTVDTQARVIFPNLTAHPARPGSGWVRPEDRGLGLPSRLDLMLSALTNHLPNSSLGLLADPKWKGTTADLRLAFASGSAAQQQVAGLSFARDYFPHGGVIGGGYIQMPRALYEAPPAGFYTILNPTNDPISRLTAAADYLSNYILQTRQAGALGFYVPAPNPPSFTTANGVALTPRALLDSIRNLRPEDARFGALYPGGEFFLRGYLNGQLLDVPLVQATLEARLADTTYGTNASFHATGKIPAGSWLDAFSPGASLDFELKGAPPETIESAFSNRLTQVHAILDGPRTSSAATAAVNDVIADLQSKLPKVKLEASLPLQMPAPIRDVVQYGGGTWLYAYSPRFEPGYSTSTDTPVARARRNGGLAMRGALNFQLNGATLAAIADGELEVSPAPPGLPNLSGVFSVSRVSVGALALRDARLEFTSGGSPRYGVRGSVSPLIYGNVFRLDPITGTDLTASLEVSRSGGTASGALSLSPSRLKFGTASYLIHGGRRTNDFTFSTTGPWSAALEVTNQIELKVGAIVFLRIVPTALATPVSVSGVGLSSLEFSASLQSGGTSLQVFPDTTFAQTLETKADSTARITVRSDGTFELSGTLNRDLVPLGLPGLTVTTLKEGGSFLLNQNGLRVDGQLAGGVLTQFGGPNFASSGHFTLSSSGLPTVTGDGALAIPSFGTPFLALEGGNGGPISATLSTSGLTLTGARLIAPGLMTNSVPAFTIDTQGNFLLTVGPTGSSFGAWSFSSLSYQILRSNGVLAITNLNAQSASPAFSTAEHWSGFVTGTGIVDLRGSRTDGLIANYPISTLDLGLRRGVGNVRSAILASSPLAYWRLGDSGKPPVAASETSSKADGVYQDGSTYGEPGALTGDANRSVRFNGKGGQVIVGNEQFFDGIGSEITVEAWVKVNAFDRAWNTIIAKGDSSWRLQRSANADSLAFDTDGLNPPYLPGTRAVNDGQWHYVVASYDGRIKSLWIDGQLDAWVAASGAIAQNDFPVVIGNNAQTGGRDWNGWIDEVAVYSHALTPTELATHHQASGGLEGTASLRIQIPFVEPVTLSGTLGANGGLGLVAEPPSLNFGGFALTEPRLQFFATAGSPASLLVDGTLSFSSLLPTKLVGGITPGGVATLTGSAPGATLLGFGFTDLALQLTGTATTGSLAVGGNLGVSGLGTLAMSGSVAANGELALTNRITSSTSLFGYPISSGEFVLRHEGRNYRTILTGDPLVPVDQGDAPLGYWRLGETTGTSAVDSKKTSASNPALPGTYFGGVTLGQTGALPGDANGSVGFDGINDFVEINNKAAFDAISTAVTVEAWVKTAGWSKNWEALVTKGDSTWRLSRYNNSRQVSFDTTSSIATNGSQSLPGISIIDDNRWHHLVGVYDGVAKYLYVDGVLEGFTPYREPLAQNTFAVRIGENAQATGRYFKGQMDEVAIYAKALTPLQILTHYRAGGGSGLNAGIRYELPGLGGVDLTGTLQPSGALSVQTSGAFIPLTGFNLGTAAMSVIRTSGGSVNAVLGGTVSTPLGTVYVAGTLPSNGAYTLETSANGALTVGDRTLTYSAPAKLTKSGFESTGTLAFGKFGFAGTAKVSTGGTVSFAGTTSGTTDKKPFGLRLNGSPGHPYAWLDWNAAASYDGTSHTIKATVGGSITIEYEGPPNVYQQDVVSFPTANLQVGGNITVTPGKAYLDIIHNVQVPNFSFTLPFP